MPTYPVTIHHIYISPAHNYFGRPKDGPGAAPTLDVEAVEAHAGYGLAGDRYFGVPAHYNAQITFVSAEVFAALRAHFERDDLSPVFMRRNVVIEGAPLNALIGQPFALEFTGRDGTEILRFEGKQHCAPCAWMDAMIAPGALKFLHGRGGLRARIVEGGLLRRGPALLHSATPLDLDAVTAPIVRARLP